MLSAAPLDAHATWRVELPAARPIRLRRSLDGGSTFDVIAVLSEAATASTFDDGDVPATAFPLYDHLDGEAD